MEILLMLLAAYGIAFFVQNKLPRMDDAPELLDKLMSCIYCLGFWSGLVVHLLSHAMDEGTLIGHLVRALLFGFGSSAFSYSLDTLVRWLEESRHEADEPDEEDD